MGKGAHSPQLSNINWWCFFIHVRMVAFGLLFLFFIAQF